MGCPCARQAAVRDRRTAAWSHGSGRSSRRSSFGEVSRNELRLNWQAEELSSSAPTQHSTRQRIVLQGFSDPENPKTLSTIHIPLAQNNVGSPRPASFLPSSASLIFHPVSLPSRPMSLVLMCRRWRWCSLLEHTITPEISSSFAVPSRTSRVLAEQCKLGRT